MSQITPCLATGYSLIAAYQVELRCIFNTVRVQEQTLRHAERCTFRAAALLDQGSAP